MLGAYQALLLLVSQSLSALFAASKVGRISYDHFSQSDRLSEGVALNGLHSCLVNARHLRSPDNRRDRFWHFGQIPLHARCLGRLPDERGRSAQRRLSNGGIDCGPTLAQELVRPPSGNRVATLCVMDASAACGQPLAGRDVPATLRGHVSFVAKQSASPQPRLRSCTVAARYEMVTRSRAIKTPDDGSGLCKSARSINHPTEEGSQRESVGVYFETTYVTSIQSAPLASAVGITAENAFKACT
ncbi:hypothetical protein EDB85DRAFT_1892842 [Lactarius pseudohatsudake]|nr:hypothetical protein EDB85DRAFT_1892842 [Lactarius pseudohatsudake]